MISQAFKDRIGVQVIDLSIFEDRNGYWAKDWSEVVRVRVAFADAVTTFLEPADFRSLSKVQQDLIRHAPSSPLPP